MALLLPKTKAERQAFAERHRDRWIKQHPEYLTLQRALEKAKQAAENPPHHLDVLSYLNGANSALAHVGEVERALEAKKKALDNWWGTNAPGWAEAGG